MPAPSAGITLNERLARMVERHFGSQAEVPDALRPFLAELNAAVQNAEEDRALLHRSADDGARELLERYRRLQSDWAAHESAQAALRESDRQFRELAEHVGAATFIYRGPTFLYVNAAASELTGYPRDELLRMKFWELVHPDFRELVRDRGLARQRGEEVPRRYEFRIVRKDGTLRWVDFTAGAVTYAGEPAALGTCFDVTPWKEAEQTLQRQALTFENQYDAVIISDTGGRITDWNPAAERMYGFARDVALGRTAVELWINGDEGEELNRRIVETLEAEGRWQGEIRFFRKDGSAGVS
ncbi:MAG: PAS domain S-box protein, partial [Gemmatimonadetes bacterium]|nr:PAS domain S-box protein [Gemmatimonadota bacterium]